MIKKILSLGLAACMLTSAAAISASANAGDPVRRPVITDVVPADMETNTYYFYMPTAWRNTYNDSYDGASLDSCTAGIYWFDGDCKPDDNHEGLDNAWPGYVVKETLAEDSNIFVAKVPKSVTTIIWNNTVDGGAKKEDDPARYVAAIQTANIGTEYYSPNEDGYGFYPNGNSTFDKMIYVCNPNAIDVNEFSGKETYKGVWFTYYGNGEYGIEPTKAEAEAGHGVYKNGEFPKYGFQVDETASVKVGETKEINSNDSTAVAEVEDASIATIAQDATTGKVSVTGVKVGTTKVKFTVTSGSDVETKECVVTVTSAEKKTNTLKVTAKKVTVKAKDVKKKAKTVKAITVKKNKGKVTYTKKSGKFAVNKTTGKITVKKGTKKGTYKVKVAVKAAGNADYKAATKNVTVTIKVK